MSDPEILDPSFSRERWVPARRRRLFLAVYIDFLIFSVPWTYLALTADRVLTEPAVQPWYARYMVFGMLELLLLRGASMSPGAVVLGIRFLDAKSGQIPVDRLWRNRVPFVDAGILRSEYWLSLLVGIYLLLEASKTLVRWGMFSPPFPLFGYQPEGALGGFTSISIGSIEAYVACCVLRARRRAALIGVPFYMLMMASAAVSWRLWDRWAERYVVGRRIFQGLPVDPGEIESLQAITPEIVLVAIFFNIALLLLITGRLKPGPRS